LTLAPAEALAPFHEWARTREPGWTYGAARVLLTPVALGLYRTRALGRAHLPPAGAFILAPNHFSNMDHFFCCVCVRRRIRFMSKSQFFGNNPALSYVFRVSGHFPVRRGHHDEEAFVTAHASTDTPPRTARPSWPPPSRSSTVCAGSTKPSRAEPYGNFSGVPGKIRFGSPVPMRPSLRFQIATSLRSTAALEALAPTSLRAITHSESPGRTTTV
jgi:hypothetical protein